MTITSVTIQTGTAIGASTYSSVGDTTTDTLLIDNAGYYLIDGNGFYVRLVDGVVAGDTFGSMTVGAGDIPTTTVETGDDITGVTISPN